MASDREETAEERIRRRIEEVAEEAANAEEALHNPHSPDTIALGRVMAEELRILRSEILKDTGRMIDTAFARIHHTHVHDVDLMTRTGPPLDMPPETPDGE